MQLRGSATGKLLFQTTPVVAGQPDSETPEMVSPIFRLVAHPTWTVPESIIEDELKDKSDAYFRANNMTRKNGRIVQEPGPKNSLGLVKFMFPNSYNIYLHDTPARSLFQRDVRAFSHGCIRVENPNALAQWVLGWDEARVEEAMERGSDNRTIRLDRKIPVYIAYFTAYEKDGRLHFGNDLYSKDDRLAEVMNPGARPSAAMLQQLEALRKLVAE